MQVPSFILLSSLSVQISPIQRRCCSHRRRRHAEISPVTPPPPSVRGGQKAATVSLVLLLPLQSHWVRRYTLGQMSYVGPDGTRSTKWKSKNFSPIKCRPQNIFFARSVAFAVDIMSLKKILVTAISDLGNTQSHLLMKFTWMIVFIYTVGGSVCSPDQKQQ